MFEIGNSLREARVRRGIDFAQAEIATKIRGKYLRALEDEQFDMLPAETYVKGFLRTYAEYLGLDGDVYVDEYASRFITSWRDELPPPPRRRRPSRERTVERRAVLLALAGIAVLAALVFAAWRYGGSSGKTPGVASTTQQRQRHTAPAPHLTLRGVGKGTFLVVRRGSKSGRLLFQGTLGSGTLQRFTGRRFYVFARRTHGLRIVSQSSGVTVVGKA